MIHDIIRKRLLEQKGLIETKPPMSKEQMLSLFESEATPEFHQLMTNRLVMGAIRYGKIEDAQHAKYGWDGKKSMRIDRAIAKLQAYQQLGNDELLVDAANYCALEFVYGNHPAKHFNATDDTDHCKTIK